MDRVSSVGIATRNELDGPGIESRWGRNIPHLSRSVLRLTQPLIQFVPGLPPPAGVQRPGRGVEHPPPYCGEVKESVELYLYSTSGIEARLKKAYLQEVGCGYMDWIGLAQDRDRWRKLVSAVMNLRVP